ASLARRYPVGCLAVRVGRVPRCWGGNPPPADYRGRGLPHQLYLWSPHGVALGTVGRHSGPLSPFLPPNPASLTLANAPAGGMLRHASIQPPPLEPPGYRSSAETSLTQVR